MPAVRRCEGGIHKVNDLADIVAPLPPSWLPQTAGWLVLGVCLLALLAWLGWRAWRSWRANRYRRAALAELARLQPGLAAEGTVRAQALLSVAELLKRTVLAVWPRDAVAGLSGPGWRDFLQAHAGKAPDAVAPLAALIDAEYRGGTTLAQWPAPQATEAGTACRRWIAGHRAPPRGGH